MAFDKAELARLCKKVSKNKKKSALPSRAKYLILVGLDNLLRIGADLKLHNVCEGVA
jgi:hypothetical protein